MVVIRLARKGAKKHPFYHIVAADKRRASTGRFIEKLGYFDPFAKDHETDLLLDLTRIDYWIGNGAQLSDRAKGLVKAYRKNHAKAAA